MNNEIFFDGKRYISAYQAAELANFTRDYVSRLCRENKIRGRLIGKSWYVHKVSFQDFLILQEYTKSKSRRSLAQRRRIEYRARTVENLPNKLGIRKSEFVDALANHQKIQDMVHVALTPQSLLEKIDALLLCEQKKPGNRLQEALALAYEQTLVPVREGRNEFTGSEDEVHSSGLFVQIRDKAIALSLALTVTFGTYVVARTEGGMVVSQGQGSGSWSGIQWDNHSLERSTLLAVASVAVWLGSVTTVLEPAKHRSSTYIHIFSISGGRD